MDNLLKELQEKLQYIDRKMEELHRKVNDLLSSVPGWVPDWVVNGLRDAWNDLCTTIDEELGIYDDAIDQCGEPWTLRPAADSWTTSVADKVSGLEGHVNRGALTVDNKFEGSSAENYRDQLPVQGKALDNLAPNFCKPLSEGLDKLASAINTFIGCLIGALVPVGILIVAGIAACCGIISAPPGIGAIAAGVIVAAGAAYAGYVVLRSGCEDVQNAWNTAQNNWSGYDIESWPQSTVA